MASIEAAIRRRTKASSGKERDDERPRRVPRQSAALKIYLRGVTGNPA
jgi:hypothetical protein